MTPNLNYRMQMYEIDLIKQKSVTQGVVNVSSAKTCIEIINTFTHKRI